MPTKIEWADETWNPVTGCNSVSEGCEKCYARRMARRLKAMGTPGYEDGFAIRCHPDRLEKPLHWRDPRRIFVCSMGDLFHADVPFEFVKRVIDIARVCTRHTFYLLTKRAPRMRVFALEHKLPHNVWCGVTVETAWCRERIDYLRATPAHVKFLSLEPLLSPLGKIVGLRDLHWVIAGCETGSGARRTEIEWIREIKDQCVEAGVPFFLKQMVIGGVLEKLPELDGQIWTQRPRNIDSGTGLAL